ncbi:MAG: DUF4268 domain-containing protein [Bacteroidales bacterium]|nr:DUF4268 domain-containing protein [Bacteroidales bacterium]
MIDRITRVPLRDIWKHEAKDFTVWISENMDVLKEAIGIELVNAEREQSTGNFNVDILAEDTSGNAVIIENQLGKSDHDHLGKIITYLTSFEAKIAIWIVAEPRQEHINAFSWLNESTNSDFYLLKIEAIKIGESSPAPLITLIIGPSEQAKQVGTAKKNISERHKLRYKFWEQLLEKSKELNFNLFNSISPNQYNWLGITAGKKGIQYAYTITQEAMRVEIWIDRGKDSNEENLHLLNMIKKQQEKIEADFGEKLKWDEAEEYRLCAIRHELKIGGYKSLEEEWEQIQEKTINSMMKLVGATNGVIGKLKI